MNDLSFLQLGQTIRQIFTEPDRYMFDKYVPVFKVEGKYFGDSFSMVMVEPLAGKAPIFYHTFSPYDVVSKKAPDQALVFQDGTVILNTDFTSYVPMRTAVMSPLVFKELGAEVENGKILLVGTGRVAKQALSALKQHYPSLKSIDFVNTRGQDDQFTNSANELGIAATPSSLDRLAAYDFIICHTNSKQPVLTADHLKAIKPGAIITTFVSEDFCEVADEFYNTNNANVIVDWDQTIPEAVELDRAVKNKLADPGKLIRLKELFSGKAKIDVNKKYTIYRSHGTPMQNLAVLKNLLANKH